MLRRLTSALVARAGSPTRHQEELLLGHTRDALSDHLTMSRRRLSTAAANTLMKLEYDAEADEIDGLHPPPLLATPPGAGSGRRNSLSRHVDELEAALFRDSAEDAASRRASTALLAGRGITQAPELPAPRPLPESGARAARAHSDRATMRLHADGSWIEPRPSVTWAEAPPSRDDETKMEASDPPSEKMNDRGRPTRTRSNSKAVAALLDEATSQRGLDPDPVSALLAGHGITVDAPRQPSRVRRVFAAVVRLLFTVVQLPSRAVRASASLIARLAVARTRRRASRRQEAIAATEGEAPPNLRRRRTRARRARRRRRADGGSSVTTTASPLRVAIRRRESFGRRRRS